MILSQEWFPHLRIMLQSGVPPNRIGASVSGLCSRHPGKSRDLAVFPRGSHSKRDASFRWHDGQEGGEPIPFDRKMP